MEETSPEKETKRRGMADRVARGVVSLAAWMVVALGVLWAFGALWYDFPLQAAARWVAGGFLAAVVAACFGLRPRWRGRLVAALAVVLVLVWWLTLQPRQFRDWKTEVALLSHAEIDGEVVTLHNVRNFDYRTDTDFTPRYDQRRFDLRNLRAVDIFINYWGSPFMAHPIVSFDFGPDGRVCFSIETRPQKGQAYSAIGGLYRQFELIYVVADERDVIRLRTNFRQGEDVYLYRLKARQPRQMFLEYVRTLNELRETPRWYNAITNNCTTAFRHQRDPSERSPRDWRMLVNGFGDELLYERGQLDNSLPFAELKRRAHVNQRARAAGDDPNFSDRIREGVPGM